MTRSNRCRASALLTLVAMIGLPAESAAQRLTERVATVRDGDVRFTFAAREGVCGHNQGEGWVMRRALPGEWESGCRREPVRVALSLERGRVTDVRTYVGGEWLPSDGRVSDLGTVSAPEAAQFLVTVGSTAEERPADRAIAAAALADSADVWRQLLALARDENRPTRVRRTATFWVAQAAGERITSELRDMVASDSMDLDVREHAVFALSRRPRDEAIPALIEIARGPAHPRIRQRALFWLGQSRDERAMRLFEELLRGG